MRAAYDAATVRAAEEPLLAALPDGSADGARGHRAGAGLRRAAGRRLRRPGAAARRRRRQRRRRAARRRAAGPSRRAGRGAAARRPGARGRARRAAAGRRPGRRRGRRRPTWWSTACSASAAAAGCAPGPPRWSGSCPRTPWSSPSTCPAASTPSTGEVAGDGRARRRHGHLRRAQDRAARRPGRRARRRRRAGRHRPRPAGGATSRCCRPTTSPRCCRGRTASRTSTAAASSAWRRAPRSTPARRCCAPAARCAAAPGWCATSAPTSRPPWCGRAGPRWSSARAGCRPGRSAPAAAPTRPRGSSGRSPTAYRSSSTPTRSTALRDHRGRRRCRSCSPRTPASSPGWSAPTVPTSRPGGCTTPAPPPATSAPSCCSRARRRWWPGPDGRVRVNPTGTPALATAGSGRRAGRAVRGAARRRAGPVRRRLGRRLAARAGRPARRRRTGARSPRATCSSALPAVPLRRLGAVSDASTPSPGSTWVRSAPTSRRSRRAPTAEVMAVVKADGYGHGLVPSARAAVEGGATWLGTALLDEALALRAAGITAPRVLAWLLGPGEACADALRADIDLSVNAGWALDEVLAAARETGATARVHLKVDSGLSRGGARPGRLAGPGRGGSQGRGRGCGAGRRPVVALRLRRRARPPDDRRARPRCSATPWRTRRRPGSTPRSGTSPTRPRP